MTGERQATRIRGLYLKAVLRQDIAYFDKEMTTGKVTGRISSDTVLIQDAIVKRSDIFSPTSYFFGMCFTKSSINDR